MNHKIIADSGCDLTPQMKKEMNISMVPLTMNLGEQEFTDNEKLNLSHFLTKMKTNTKKTGSAAPSASAYQEEIEKADSSFVITLSSQLSGSYSSALAGKSMAEESGHTDAYIIDSKSASAGETLISLKLHELISLNFPKEKIIQTIEHFIDNMKTYFVLENHDNLQKNGRLGKLTGTIIRLLNIKLIMGSDGKGSITLFKKARGLSSMITELLKLIENSGKQTKGENLVISHCDNLNLAKQLSEEIQKRFNFKKIWLVPTGGLCSLYADHKGIILAF